MPNITQALVSNHSNILYKVGLEGSCFMTQSSHICMWEKPNGILLTVLIWWLIQFTDLSHCGFCLNLETVDFSWVTNPPNVIVFLRFYAVTAGKNLPFLLGKTVRTGKDLWYVRMRDETDILIQSAFMTRFQV